MNLDVGKALEIKSAKEKQSSVYESVNHLCMNHPMELSQVCIHMTSPYLSALKCWFQREEDHFPQSK